MKKRFCLIFSLSIIISLGHFIGFFSYNPFQIFLSFSGMACSKETPSDLDGDGIADLSDNCPTNFNPRQTDEDQNNRGDLCEGLPSPLTCEEILRCESMDDCSSSLESIITPCLNSPGVAGEGFVCCDQRCTAADPMTGGCPAGACLSPGGHCAVDGDCPQEAPTCLDGCCTTPPEEVLCPNGESAPQCCPPEAVCDAPAFPPCPDGETCDFDGCCIPL